MMAMICFFTPVAFSSYTNTDAAAPFMYWISESGGVYGTTILLIIIALPLALPAKGTMKRLLRFVLITLFLGGVLGSLAYINEHFVKPAAAAPRPSHEYLEKKGVIASLPQFYSHNQAERAKILEKEAETKRDKVEHVYPAILRHWIFESGFSFPSGHSQNAFLLATLVAFLLFYHAKGSIRYAFLIPLLWAVLVCISRVAIGIHTKYDVAAGSFIGLLIASIIILSGLPQKMLPQRMDSCIAES